MLSKRIAFILSFLCLGLAVQSQVLRQITFSARAGLNVGAASPLSLPVEIREIKGYSPNLNPSIECDVSFPLSRSDSSRWFLVAGLRCARQSMQTHARVKNYHTEISSNGNTVSGVWTGDVVTRYSDYALSLPVRIDFQIASSCHLLAGMYASWLFSKHFGGSVMDGYLRQGSPIGEKVVFDNGQTATYEFDDQLLDFHYGIEAGVQYDFLRAWFVSGILSLGLNDIFRQDFNTVSFSMHPIFFNLSIGRHLGGMRKREQGSIPGMPLF